MRCMLAALLIAVTLSSGAGPARAVVEVDITQGQIQPVPIAIAPFLGEGKFAAEITNIISSDLEGSGLFKPVDQQAFIERIADIDAYPRFENWRPLNAQALAVGSVSDDGHGKIQARFRLWDVFSGKQLTGEQFSMSSDSWRRVGHMIAELDLSAADRRERLFRHPHRVR